jgi:transposase
MNNSIVQLKIEQVNQPESSAAQKSENLVTVPRNRFLISNNEQTVMWLSPRSMVSEDHLVWFIDEAVNRLDLSAFVAGSGGTDARGRRSYNPAMLVKLIAYCRATGRHSSRQIAKAAQEDIPCRLLTFGQQPHHDTIANFENVNRAALATLFTQSLNLATEADLIELDIVAVEEPENQSKCFKTQGHELWSNEIKNW